MPITNDGGGGITKLGPGSLVFNFSSAGVGNLYTGMTTIVPGTLTNGQVSGTLLVNGSMPNSAITVTNGATLGGIGTVGAITVNQGGRVSPGDSPGFLAPPNDLGDGILTASSANFTTGATLSIQAASNATAGSTYDRLAVIGALTLAPGANITGDFTGLASGATIGGVATYGTLSGTFATPPPANFINVPSGDEAVVNYNAVPNAVSLVVGSATVSAAFAPSSLPAYSGQPITVNAVPPVPPSGNPVTLTYVWYKNGVQVQPPAGTNPTPTTLTSNTLSASIGTKLGDMIMVVVTPFDGNTAGASATISTVVAATPPVVTVEPDVEYPDGHALSTLTATASTADADGLTPVTLTYVSGPAPTRRPESTTVVQTTPTAGTTTSGSDALEVLGNARAGQTITVTVTPTVTANNTVVTGTPVSMTVTVLATPPTATVNITPATPTVGTVLTATATTSDLNGLPVALTYIDWSVNNKATVICRPTPACWVAPERHAVARASGHTATRVTSSASRSLPKPTSRPRFSASGKRQRRDDGARRR